MNDDDLRTRLRRVDPCPSEAAIDRAGTRHAQNLLEAVMTTPIETQPTAEPDGVRSPGARRWLLPAAAAGAIGVIAVASALTFGGGGDDKPGTPPGKDVTLTLAAPDSTVMASCLPFDLKILAGMSPAFGGTVTEVSSDKVVLDVDRWFSPKGSDVTRVELTTGSPVPVSIDGVEFEQGKRYLVTAAEGTVNTCGYTGLATPDYEASFEQAFGG